MDDMNYPFGTSEEVEIEDKTSTSESDGNKASDREVIDKKLRQFFDVPAMAAWLFRPASSTTRAAASRT